MILSNGTTVQLRVFGGTLGAQALKQGLAGRIRMSNAQFHGLDKSWPEGYQSVLRALVPPFEESGQVASRILLDLDMTAVLSGRANMAASGTLDVDMTANANVRSNAYATIAVDVDMTAAMRAAGNLSAVFDLVGRPSAVDISQEVWNGFVVEDGLSGAEVLRVLLAVAAGKTNIVPGSPTVVTFRDQLDTKNRVRAEMTASERDAVTIDGA